MRIMGVVAVVFGLMCVPFWSTSAFYVVCTVLAIGWGAVHFIIPDSTNSTNSTNSTDTQPPTDGFVTFDPETGEEIRIINGRDYRVVNGRLEEIPRR